MHGDTVCASIDLREHSAVKLLTQEYLEEAAAATSQYQQQQQQSSHLNTTSPLLSASLQHGSASAAAASIASSDVQQKQVILAPYGMSAILTGNSIKNGDAAADKLLEEWGLFYPMCNTENSDIPPVVEVISGKIYIFPLQNIIFFTNKMYFRWLQDELSIKVRSSHRIG